MEYIFKGQMTENDFIQYNKVYFKESLLKGKNLLLLGVIVAVFLIAGLSNLFDVISTGKPFLESMFLWEIVFVGIFMIAVNFYLKKTYKKYYESDKSYKQERTFHITEKIIKITTPNSETSITKDLIYKIIFDEDSIYIFTGKNIGHIIKERYLDNKQKYDSLKEFIRKYYL